MRYSIFGFNQEKALSVTKTIERNGKTITLSLDVTDLLITQQLADFPNRKHITKNIINDKIYFWASYKEILSELPILNIKKQALADRLNKLVELGIIERATVDGVYGKTTLFRMGDAYEELLYSRKGNNEEYGEQEGCVVDYTGVSSQLQDGVCSEIHIITENNNKSTNNSFSFFESRKTANGKYDYVDASLLDVWSDWAYYAIQQHGAKEAMLRSQYDTLIEYTNGDVNLARQITKKAIDNGYKMFVAPKVTKTAKREETTWQ